MAKCVGGDAAVIPWLKAVSDSAPEYCNGFMKKVYRWKDYQLATDGHILVLCRGDVEELPTFPRKIDAWFAGEPRLALDCDAFRKFCNPAIYAAACPGCKGACKKKCLECVDYTMKELCEDCGGAGFEACWHSGGVTNYGYLRHVAFNRSILWKLLAHVSDKQIRFALGTDKQMLRFDGDGWRAALMPINQDLFSKEQLESYPRFHCAQQEGA